MKLYLDPGHGGADPGAQGNGLSEKDITLDISLKIRTFLVNNFENIDIRMCRTSDITKSLEERTKEANAWGADFYLAIHCNAANGSAQGYEDYIHTPLSDSSATAKYRDIIHEEVIKRNQLKDRGKKKQNFHVLRESTMPAFLSENGFIDHPQDAALMKQGSWRENVAQGHADGIAKAFNLKRKANPTPQPIEPKPTDPNSTTLYKVIAGSFKSRQNANDRVALLKAMGNDAFVTPATISDESWYRVQVGAFSTRENAEKRLEEINKTGISDVFIIISNNNDGLNGGANNDLKNNDNVEPAQNPPTGYSILGPTHLSPELMNRFVKEVNPNGIELGSYYLTFGEYYGIRGDIAFAQALHETDYFRFTGVVKPEQNNFAGIGATGSDNRGASFASAEEGVLAHLQHLFAYASTNSLPNQYQLVDPRFNLIKRGSAPTWIDLNGKWAVPGITYGQSILNLYERMILSAIQNLEAIRNP